MKSKQNRNFRPKGEGRSGRRPLLPKRKLNILVDLTLGKSYHSVVTFLHENNEKFIRDEFIEFYCYLKSVCLLEGVKNCLRDIQTTINADI